MPYERLSELPEAAQKLPEHGQEIFRAAFNAAYDEYDGDEERAFATAWAAVKKQYVQAEDGTWSEKARGEGQGDGGAPQGDGGADTCVCPECGATAEHERGTPCAELDCPECGATMAGQQEKAGLWAALKAAWERFWPAEPVAAAEPVPPEPQGGPWFQTFKAADGQTWLRVWTTNAFQDRDGETFSTKSIEDYAERMAAAEDKGRFDFWHVPGSEFGTIKAVGTAGRFLVEMGPFDDTPIGRAFKEFFTQYPESHPAIAPDGWGASHRFAYHAQDRRPDGTFEWFQKDRTTVLPIGAAANPWTKSEVIMAMTDEQKKAFDAIGQETGVPNLAEEIEREGEARTKELEAQGIAHKQAQADEPPAAPEASPSEPEPEETAPEEEPPAVEGEKAATVSEVAAAVTQIVNPLLEQIKALTAQQEQLQAQVAGLQADEKQRLQEVVATTPGASLAAMIMEGLKVERAIGDPVNRVDGRTKEAKGPRQTPAASEGTGIGLLDTLLAGQDWREALPGVRPAGNQ